ncbi:hypothetical protein [Leptolyngbya sp. BC1307]|uniref:hypothetical protein n=1 Tax=Leptolyngbya sp. BC1307 TaxID=2029589 RepID=UPI000EFB4BFB|nr:hypothetical protein [Leptolyngbya sp. BC1307]
MLKSPYLFAIGILVTLLSWTGTAKAYEDNLGLSFALPSARQQPATDKSSAQASSSPIPQIEQSVEQKAVQPLEQPTQQAADEELIRYQESLPPITGTLPESEPVPAKISHQKDSIGLSFANNSVQMPAETDSRAIQKGTDRDDTAEANAATEIPVEFPTGNISNKPSEPPSELIAQQPADPAYNTLGLDDWIFDGGSSSLVARTVGSAEGTRMSDGGRTPAYYGHTDPGNGVWNMGTFSYQHGASTPEEADEKQLSRLRNQGLQLEEKAAGLGVKLSLEAKLNGIDLANQAPLAALDRGGYIERLAEANRLGMRGQKAILWARTYAYIDPDTQTWNAPGLGNNVHSISRDQERRALAISRALQAYDPNGAVSADSLASTVVSTDEPLVVTAETTANDLREPRLSAQTDAYVALSFGLPPSDAEVLASIAPPAAPVEALPNSSQIDLAFQPADADSGEALEGGEVLESAQDVTVAPTLFGMEEDEYDDSVDQTAAESDASIEAIFDIPGEASSSAPIEEQREETDRRASLSEGLTGHPSQPLVAERLAESDEPSAVESSGDVSPTDIEVTDTEAIAPTNLALPAAPIKTEEKSNQPARRELLWRNEDKIIRQK